MIEQEVKLALPSEEVYDRLCAHLGIPRTDVIQKNTYWDRPDRSLTDGGIMVRLRCVGDRVVLTVKAAATRDDRGLFQAFEDEEEIPLNLARMVLAGDLDLGRVPCPVIDRLLERAGPLVPLESWGAMENRRRAYPLPSGLVLEVDRTMFSRGVVHWEVEAESDDPERATREVCDLLDGIGIEYAPQTRTKSERLRAILAGEE